MQSKSESKGSRSDAPTGPVEELPYYVELWHDGAGASVERILARAGTGQLARAIFKAATDEHPNRRVTLRKGQGIIADSLP